MAHENPIISKIKIPQNETPYEICDKNAVHYGDTINADTLQGHPASDFATPAFVVNKIAEAQLGGGSDIDLSGYATKDDLNSKADSSHTHRSLKANDDTGTVILGNETNSNNGTNYYFRPDAEGANDVHYLGTSKHIWDKAYIGDLTLTTALPVTQGGTGATKAADARTNLGFTGGITTAITNNFSTNRAIISNADGKLASSDITSAELGYLDGVTSNIQTQLNNKAPSDHTHRDLTTNSGNGIVRVGHEANSNDGVNYYLRSIKASENDEYVLGSSSNPWDRAYIGDLTLTTALAVKYGGTGASNPADARANLDITPANIGAASLGANTFTGNQLLNNNVKIRTARADGTAMNLLYMSENNNIIIGSSDYTDTQPIIMYGNPDIRGYIKLDSSSYGKSLPTAGTAGRVFFKKVSS